MHTRGSRVGALPFRQPPPLFVAPSAQPQLEYVDSSWGQNNPFQPVGSTHRLTAEGEGWIRIDGIRRRSNPAGRRITMLIVIRRPLTNKNTPGWGAKAPSRGRKNIRSSTAIRSRRADSPLAALARERNVRFVLSPRDIMNAGEFDTFVYRTRRRSASLTHT